MKKVMIIVAAFAMATAVQAASFMWSASTGSSYAGMNVFCITGTTAADVATLFGANDDASKWSQPVKGLTPSVASLGARGVALGEVANVEDGANLVFAIIDGDIAEGNKWFVMDYKIPAGTTFTPPTTGAAQKVAMTSLTSGSFALKSGPVDPSGVPEPTSGLLLVLGGAALALRRKQK